MHAAFNGHGEVVKLLYRHGADLNPDVPVPPFDLITAPPLFQQQAHAHSHRLLPDSLFCTFFPLGSEILLLANPVQVNTHQSMPAAQLADAAQSHAFGVADLMAAVEFDVKREARLKRFYAT